MVGKQERNQQPAHLYRIRKERKAKTAHDMSNKKKVELEFRNLFGFQVYSLPLQDREVIRLSCLRFDWRAVVRWHHPPPPLHSGHHLPFSFFFLGQLKLPVLANGLNYSVTPFSPRFTRSGFFIVRSTQRIFVSH